MGRPHRRGSETGMHHVMNRGVDRQPIFFADSDRLEMGRRLAAIHETFSASTIAYCLMGNHIHLVLQAPDGALPDAMHHLTSVYSRQVNDRIGRDGPLFRGRYHSIPVESDAYLLWVARYVHRNPLDIGGVRSPRDYRWSSYRAYLGLRPAPPFLDRRPVMDIVGGRIEELVAITEDAAPPGLQTIEDVVRLIRCARAIEDLDEPNVDRTLLLLLAERTDDPKLAQAIHRTLGPRTDGAIRQATRRAEARRSGDVVLARALSWIQGQLSPAA